MTDPNVARRVTGRANALTRGKGKKLGLKKPPNLKAAGKRKSGAPKPPRVESFGGEFSNRTATGGRVIPLRGAGSGAPTQADGGFRGRPKGTPVTGRETAGSRGTVRPGTATVGMRPPRSGEADGGFRPRGTPVTGTDSGGIRALGKPTIGTGPSVQARKGPSSSAYAHASPNASFKRSVALSRGGALPRPPAKRKK
jgi:hypothetical protein